MPDSKNPDFFEALALVQWRFKIPYRVYASPTSLIFIRAESTTKKSEHTEFARHYGMLGGVADALSRRVVDKENAKLLAERERLDNTPLSELINEHKDNFVALIDDISNASVDPVPGWLRFIGQVEHEGFFRFNLEGRGKQQLEFPRVEEMKLALELLPRCSARNCKSMLNGTRRKTALPFLGAVLGELAFFG
jgi:hypothetical protein